VATPATIHFTLLKEARTLVGPQNCHLVTQCL